MINLKNLRFVQSNETDRSQWSTLEVRREDIEDVIPALGWASLDYLHNITIPRYRTEPNGSSVPVQYNEAVNKIEIPGRFSIQFSADDIAEIIETWKLLRDHYAHYLDLLKASDSKPVSAALSYLLDKSEGKNVELQQWVKLALEVKRNNQ